MIEVTCAVIRNDDDMVLVVQRGSDTDHPLKWEFPGGKKRETESLEECILREVEEELSLDIVIYEPLSPVEHDYGFKKIRLHPFVCDTLDDLPLLHEHADFRWVEPCDLERIDFAEADIPVAREYISLFGSGKGSPPSLQPDQKVDEDGIREILSGPMSVEACDMLAVSAAGNDDILKVLINHSFNDDGVLAFRSSWTICKVAAIDESILKPYLRQFVNLLRVVEHEAVRRSLLKIISESDFDLLTEEDHGILAEKCFSWLTSGESAIAIKAYAMEIIYRLTLIYPELSHELVSSLTREMEYGSAGVKARGRLILEKMRKNPE